MNERKHLEHAVATLDDRHAVAPRDPLHELTSYTARDLEIERRKQAVSQGERGFAFKEGRA